MESNEPIITVSHLTKRFGELAAVDDVSFSVKRGEIFAFLGPNGAGKSTTIKMLITLTKPTSGEASIDGKSITANSAGVRNTIGYVPQMVSVDGSLTARENLRLMAKLFELPAQGREEQIDSILKFLSLEQYANSLARTFSGGMIRKLEIGQAMLHHPHVLFLDEPTTGLDPIAKQNVWDHLVELREKFGTTIFFSTHGMEEADEVCDRVAIMNRGKIAVIGTSDELKRQTAEKTGKIGADGKPTATLEDAFIYFSGNKLDKGAEGEIGKGSLREIRRARQNQRRLG